MIDINELIQLLDKNPGLLAEIGDCPNAEFPTKGGDLFWKELDKKNGLRLQCNYITGLFRILDSKNVRKAWGSPVIMKEKFKRLTREEFLEPGDVIGVARKKALRVYEHYAVYIGDKKVVHYAGDDADFNGTIKVQIATLDAFLKSDKDYFVLFFEENNIIPHKIQSTTQFNLSDINYGYMLDLKKCKEYRLYSPAETVERALSRVGEDEYSLILNNCEHFAVWCKTGVSESYQVQRAVGILSAVDAYADEQYGEKKEETECLEE